MGKTRLMVELCKQDALPLQIDGSLVQWKVSWSPSWEVVGSSPLPVINLEDFLLVLPYPPVL